MRSSAFDGAPRTGRSARGWAPFLIVLALGATSSVAQSDDNDVEVSRSLAARMNAELRNPPGDEICDERACRPFREADDVRPPPGAPLCSALEDRITVLGEAQPVIMVQVLDVSHEAAPTLGNTSATLPLPLITTLCKGIDIETGDTVEVREPGGEIEARVFDAACGSPRFCKAGGVYAMRVSVNPGGECWAIDHDAVTNVTALFDGSCQQGGGA